MLDTVARIVRFPHYGVQYGMSPRVDEYMEKAARWKAELTELREIVLDSGLSEDFKWRNPCYTHRGANVVILGELKECCTVSFLKGALLKDPAGVLVKPGENSRSARYLRFTSVEEVREKVSILKRYLQEAIEVEDAGLKVDFEKDREVQIPVEFQARLNERPELKAAFEALTPGRQRGYLIYFSGAKQSKSRASRVEKYIPRILDGKGMNDCVCGLSSKMPACDGSHKSIR